MRIDATTLKLLKESYKQHHIIAKRKGVSVYPGQIREYGLHVAWLSRLVEIVWTPFLSNEYF